MSFLDWIWLIPLFPLFGAAAMLLVGKKLDPQHAVEHGHGHSSSGAGKALIAIFCPGMVLLSFLLSAAAVIELAGTTSRVHEVVQYTWVAGLPFHLASGALGTFSADWGFLLDPLSSVMILVVTGVGFLIHVYSTGYMAHDGGYYRFFGYLNLFVFFMLMLVLANNYVLLFVGWEGVGLCSYLLIGFYFHKKSAGDAGKKAFIVNRIGDAGFILGMLLMLSLFGSPAFPGCEQGARRDEPGGRLRRAERDGAAAVHRRHGQVGAVPLVRLAAGRHGRPHAGFGPDPRRHHGDGRRLHGGPLERAVPADAGDFDDRGRRRRVHGDSGGFDRAGAERHQAGAGLLHREPARLHVPGLRRGRLLGGDLPPVHARVLQGPALPRLGLGDPRAVGRAGHAQDGRR